MSSLPKFDFSSMQLDDSGLDEMIAADKKANKQFFKPGNHEVKVKGLEYKGTVESDPTWHKYRVVYEGTFNKEISDLVMIPSKDVVMVTKDGEKSTYPFRKLKDQMAAVGVDLKLANLGATLDKYFGKEQALVGKDLRFEVAYAGPHVKYVGKDQAGNGQYQVVSRREEAILETIFSDYASANEAAEKEGLQLKRFVDIVKYLPSSTPNAETAAVAPKKSDW